MKKERQGQTQITTKIDGFSSFTPPHFGRMLIYFFVSVFSQKMFLELADNIYMFYQLWLNVILQQ
jgi:hypothetical protein